MEKRTPDEYLKDNGVDVFGEITQTKTIKPKETPQDADARRRIEFIQQKAQLRLDFLNFIFKEGLGVLLIITMAAGSWIILSNSNSSTKDREWARTTLSAVSGIVAGYVFGKSSKRH